MNFEKLPSGYWKVDSKKFVSKFEALKYATDTDQNIEFVFFDPVWNSFNKTLLGKQKLNDLYRRRAQQLRDEYDYLILYFSGGADSYNVLRSFIDNNIKLDEVCVKWPMLAIDKQFYTPNATDTSAFNYLSEWDYAVKPVLNSLKQTHPEIKIEIVDWTENYSPSVYSEELIKKVGPWNDVEMPMMVSYSPSENFFLDKGKRVASIYGIDKPMIGYHENKWFMCFADTATGMGVASDNDAYNVEYFYWTPKMPEIAFEQAYVVCSYLEKQKHLLNYFYHKNATVGKEHFINSIQMQNNIIKNLIYNTWSGAFQASKPVSSDRADKHFWIFGQAEFYKHRESFIDLNSLALTQLDPKFYNVETSGIQYKNKIRGIFKTIWSKWHFVKFRESL
jgi:hypothetical protein